MRRRRRGPAALLTAHLDTAWSLLVRAAANGHCERCERSDRKLDAHHYIGRGNYRVRWSPANGVCLCSWECHKGWAHNYPAEFVDWIRSYRPEDVRYVDREAAKNGGIAKWTPAEKKAMLADLRDSLALERAA